MLMLRLAWRNIWRQPRRTQLTVSAMVFSNMLLVFMIAMQTGMYSMMIDNTLRLTSGYYQLQAVDYLDHPTIYKTIANGQQLASNIRKEIGDHVSARALGFALFSSEQRSYAAQIIGVDTQHETSVSSLPGFVKQGRYLNQQDASEVVIGKALARNLQVSVGDELTFIGSGKDGSIAANVVTVVGLFDSGNQEIDRLLVHMPLVAFQQSFSMGEDVHSIVISTTEAMQTTDIEASLKQQLEQGNKQVLHDWTVLQPGLVQAIKADISSAAVMYMVLVVLCGFSVLNTVLMAVLERTREFGIFMALGLRPIQISRLVLIEAILLAFIGLVLGMLFGAVLTGYFEINGLVIPGYEEAAARFNLPSRVYPSLDRISLLVGPLCIFIAAILAAIYPALKLLRLQPLEAMRVRT